MTTRGFAGEMMKCDEKSQEITTKRVRRDSQQAKYFVPASSAGTPRLDIGRKWCPAWQF